MSREEIQKLLGGYATDTLTDAERQALFAAALEDQELFDALGKEEALREVLQEPGARRELLEALEPKRGLRQWLRRPAVLALAGGVAVLVIAAGLVLRPAKLPVKQVLVAEAVKAPAPPTVSAPGPFEPQYLLSQRAESAAPAPPVSAKKKRAVKPMTLPSAPPQQVVIAQESPAAGAAPPISRSAPVPAPMASFEMARVSANLARGYVVLLRGTDGEYAPAPPDMVFHPGDSVRIQLVPDATGYLHLYQQDSNGNWQTVSTQPVVRGQTAVAPASGALEYDEPGRKELMAVVTAEPPAAAKQAKALAGRPSAGLASDAAAREALAHASRRPGTTIRITLDVR